jgi:hypothetical protein
MSAVEPPDRRQWRARRGPALSAVCRHAALLHHEARRAARSHPCAPSRARSAGPISSARSETAPRESPWSPACAGVIGPIRACCGSSATPGLTAPGDDQKLRQAKSPGQRSQRAHGITEPRVLHHRDAAPLRASATRERNTGDQRHRIAFIGHRQVAQTRILQHVVDERREIRTRHARIPEKAPLARRLDELMRFNHGPYPRRAARRTAERRLRVGKIHRATKILEIIDATPVTMHIQHFDRRARPQSGHSAAPAYRAHRSRRRARSSPKTALSVVKPWRLTFSIPIQRPCARVCTIQPSSRGSACAALATDRSSTF